MKKPFQLLPILILTPFLLLASARTASQEAMAARIAPDILRFHVLAESNSSKDQSLKLGVRDILLQHIRNHAPQDADKSQLACWIMQHEKSLTQTAENWLSSQGCPSPVTLTLTRDYFPRKTYGNASFPCGTYDAVRVTIGNGKGRNWWCVLYPSLCFVNDTAAVVPDSSKQELACVLGEEDYQSLFLAHPDIQFTSRLAQWAKRLSDHLSILPEERP